MKLVPVSEPTPRLLNKHPEQVVALVLVGRADGLVATISQYRLAPVTALQLKVGVAEIPVAPFAGALSSGAVSRDPCAVTWNVHQFEIVPSGLTTWTCHEAVWLPKTFEIATFVGLVELGINGP